MELSEITERWIPWSTENTISYEHVPRKGAGKGEAKLAAEQFFSGAVQGGNVSYDVLDSSGRKWEVKELDKTREVRLGVESTEEVIKFWTEAVVCIRQIQELVESTGSISDEFWMVEEFRPGFEHFIDTAPQKIMRGELSKGVILGETHQNPVGLKQVCEFLGGHHYTTSKRHIAIKDLETKESADVPIESAIGLLKDLGVDYKFLCPSQSEVVRSVLRHKYFRDPGTIGQHWREVSKASVVFAKTDGVVMVKPEGYFIVPREKLDDYFKFERISQRVARFKFCTPSSGATLSGVVEHNTAGLEELPASQ